MDTKSRRREAGMIQEAADLRAKLDAAQVEVERLTIERDVAVTTLEDMKRLRGPVFPLESPRAAPRDAPESSTDGEASGRVADKPGRKKAKA
jgi:hypothetical protein